MIMVNEPRPCSNQRIVSNDDPFANVEFDPSANKHMIADHDQWPNSVGPIEFEVHSSLNDAVRAYRQLVRPCGRNPSEPRPASNSSPTDPQPNDTKQRRP